MSNRKPDPAGGFGLILIGGALILICAIGGGIVLIWRIVEPILSSMQVPR